MMKRIIWNVLQSGLYRLAIIILAASLLGQTIVAAAEFDIPLSELQKVKKKSPPKQHSSKERKKRRKEVHVPSDTAPANSDIRKSGTPDVGLPDAMPPLVEEKVQRKPSIKEEMVAPGSKSFPSVETVAGIRISHIPDTYIVGGKRTRIRAVVSSVDDITEVYCSFRSGDSSSGAVTMTKAEGTRFTYTAIIPAVSTTSQNLYYRFHAANRAGTTARSQEYAVKVTQNSVLPGWQLEHFNDALKLWLQNDVPPAGFTDPGLPPMPAK